MDTSHIVFFFGSGVSIPSGMPDVRTITGGVFNEPIVFSENGRYEHCDRADPAPNSEDRVDRVRAFLGVVSNYAQRVLWESNKPDQPVTYEDLYYLCAQVVTDQSGGATRHTDPLNLAIRPFSKKLEHDTKPFLLQDSEPLRSTAEEGCWLIAGIVRKMLNSDNVRNENILKKSFLPLLNAVNETTCHQKHAKQATIVTLNHDVLVETLLEKHCDLTPGIDFEDGFGPLEEEEGIRQYQPDRLFDDSAKIRIIKPHGSINWYFNKDNDSVALPTFDLNSNQFRRRHFNSSEPTFLSGIGKENSYQSGIFGDMVEAFQHVLRQTTTVIESGFGWQDEGMYNLMTRYLFRRPENRLLRLHQKKDPEDPASEIKLLDHAQLRSLHFPSGPEGLVDGPNYMCNTSWDEIKEELSLP